MRKFENELGQILNDTEEGTSWSVAVLDTRGRKRIEIQKGSKQTFESLSLNKLALLSGMQHRHTHLHGLAAITKEHQQKGGSFDRLPQKRVERVKLITHMLSRSNNVAYHALLSDFGGTQAVNAVLAERYPDLEGTALEERNGKSYCGLTTATDTARIFHSLAQDDPYRELLSHNAYKKGLRRTLESETSNGTQFNPNSLLLRAREKINLLSGKAAVELPKTDFPNKEGWDDGWDKKGNLIEPEYETQIHEVASINGLTVAVLSRNHGQGALQAPETYDTFANLGVATFRAGIRASE